MLVAYAARSEETKAIAERLALALTEKGHRVEVAACEEIAETDAYDALVAGSEVLGRRWLPEAEAFIRRSAPAFSDRPVWMFSIETGESHSLTGLLHHEPRGVRELRELMRPRDTRAFPIDLEDDWPHIDSWATQIGDALRVPTSKPPPPPSGSVPSG